MNRSPGWLPYSQTPVPAWQGHPLLTLPTGPLLSGLRAALSLWRILIPCFPRAVVFSLQCVCKDAELAPRNSPMRGTDRFGVDFHFCLTRMGLGHESPLLWFYPQPLSHVINDLFEAQAKSSNPLTLHSINQKSYKRT